MSAATRAHSDDRGPLLTPIAVEPQRLRRTSWKEYGIRFAFGGIVTAIVGVLGTAFGPSVAGLFLAFPAILVASLTLIGSHDGEMASGADALGAAIGAVGLAGFGVILWALSAHMAGAAVVALATVVWFAIAVACWAVLDGIRRRRKD
jgi:hypothetical protein